MRGICRALFNDVQKVFIMDFSLLFLNRKISDFLCRNDGGYQFLQCNRFTIQL